MAAQAATINVTTFKLSYVCSEVQGRLVYDSHFDRAKLFCIMINCDLMSQDHKIGSAYVKEENCQNLFFLSHSQ
jgi:hypothetical protein